MIHCIDTNVLSALLAAEPAELLAAPGNKQSHLDAFLRRGQVGVDWETTEAVWQTSGRAYSAYARRRERSGGGLPRKRSGGGLPRKRSGGGLPRRILADFLIGAHALALGATLVTLDDAHYRSAYPTLPLVMP